MYEDFVDSLESVQDVTAREFYVPIIEGENKGKFKFDPVAATQGLRKNRDDILREKGIIEGKYKGVDLTAYQKWQAEQADNARKKQLADGDFEAREKSLKDAHTAELAARDQRVTSLTKALEKNLIDATVTAAITKADGKLPILKKIVRDQVQMVEVNGEFYPRVVDESNQVRFMNGHEMTVEELLAELKSNKDYTAAFNADKASGSGATSTTRKPGAAGDTEIAKITNPVERLKAARAAK